MRVFSSIRHQVLALLLALTVSVTLIYSAVTLTTAFVVEDLLIAKVLEHSAQSIERYYAQAGRLPESALGSYQLYERLSEAPQWVQQGVTPDLHTGEIFTADDSHYHYTHLNLNAAESGYLVAEVSELLVVTQQPALVALFLACLLLALGLAVLAAYRFSNYIVRPLLSLTEAVRSWDFQEKGKPLPQFSHEVGYLADALQQAFSELRQSLEREKAFTTDVSHELRTPLTILKNTCALIETRGFKSSDLADLAPAVRQMEGTTSALLALARAESLNQEACDLRLMLEEEILNRQTHERSPLEIDLRMKEPMIVPANPILVRLLLRNIIDNAAQHGGNQALCISGGDGALAFENRLTQAVPPDVTEPGVKAESSAGVGQGLYVVNRIAQQFGWQVDIDASDHTFCIILKV